MSIFMYNSYICVHTDKLRENISAIISTLPDGCMLVPVLKCDAYGLGFEAVAGILAEFQEISCMAVAHVNEAARLSEMKTGRDIMLLGLPATPEQLEFAVKNGIIIPAHSAQLTERIALTAKALGRPARVQVKINSGLNRLGSSPGGELAETITVINSNREYLFVEGAYTHFSELIFANTDNLEKPLSVFNAGLEQLNAAGIPVPKKHVCASASFEARPDLAMDAVRIGRRIYMDNPLFPTGSIQEVASWRAPIADITSRAKGDALGYGGKCVLDRSSTVAILGVGYGDGLKKELVEAGAPVLVNGRTAKLLCCCMDLCFIDVTGIDCSVGDEVTFFGYDGRGNCLPSQEVAALIDDEGCTLTSALGPRVKRVYI